MKKFIDDDNERKLHTYVANVHADTFSTSDMINQIDDRYEEMQRNGVRYSQDYSVSFLNTVENIRDGYM